MSRDQGANGGGEKQQQTAAGNGGGSQPEAMDTVTPAARLDTPIVGIGASAGGLEALEQLFLSLPVDTGFAFVVVQHLSPDFPSMMRELLARHSRMPIFPIGDGMKVEPNTIYLRPARQTLFVRGPQLFLEREDPTPHLSLPIDVFLKSLAESRGDRAVCIVLSGTGGDGTQGAAAIREAGGKVLVQDPSSARFDSMPRSVIDLNIADAIARPEQLAGLVARLASNQPLPVPSDDEDAANGGTASPESAILRLLQRRCGTDFGYYKMSTVDRRIRRRANMARRKDLADYADLLKENTHELDLLTKDLLIGVTEFFRDWDAFKCLQEQVIAPTAERLGRPEQFRVWVPGCATGEEAYTIAMVLTEVARAADIELNVKIYATDIYSPALEIASRGRYDLKGLAALPTPLLNRYFDRSGDGYQVKSSLRRLIVFSKHNLLSDPPFTRIDLISCRNLLIYFNETAQRKVLNFFHLALKVDGTLLLGSSESLNELADEFDVVDGKWRLFRKIRDVRLRESFRLLPPSALTADLSNGALLRRPAPHGPRAGAATLSRRNLSGLYSSLMDRFAPPGVLVDALGHIVLVFGDTQRYLSIASGEFTSLLVDIVDEPFRHAIFAGLERARGSAPKPFVRHVAWETPAGASVSIRLTVERVELDKAGEEVHALVLFEEHLRPETRALADPEETSQAAAVELDIYQQRIQELEHELKTTEENLQSTIEEMETTNEELQATNEELMASNEELQSTNEELHSVNEELYTVSAEHQRKLDELLEVKANRDNILTSTEVGVIFLDKDLKLRLFTPVAARIFNLLESDVGRAFEHIRPPFTGFDLMAALKRTERGAGLKEHEVEIGDHTYLLRILPYEISDRLAGIGLTFIDVTQRKHSEMAVKAAEQQFAAVVNTAPDAIVVIDNKGSIRSANPATLTIFGYTEQELVGQSVSCLMPADQADAHDRYIESYERSKIKNIIGVGREVQGRRKDGSLVALDLAITEWWDADGEHLYAGVMRDITGRNLAKRKLTDALRTITLAAEAGEMGTWHFYIGSDQLDISDEVLRILGRQRSEWAGTTGALQATVHPDDVGSCILCGEQAFALGDRIDNEFRIVRPDHACRWVHLRGDVRRAPDGQAVEAYGVMADITERKQWEERQQLLVVELDHRVKNMLARMGAIIESSRQSATSIDDFSAAIIGRLNALARSHTHLSRSRWTGAALRTLIEEELTPYLADGNVTYDGPEVALNADATQSLSMVLHELSTNAAKYGAFSIDTGRLTIRWNIVQGDRAAWLDLRWRELGVEVIKPTRAGFGTKLIESLLSHGLGGKVDLKFGKKGVSCAMRLPIANLV
jgi:two-component system CheB/CheR fusion protein